MKIISVCVDVFSFPSRRAVDSAGHAHPGEEKPVRMGMLRIACDDGSEGFSFGPPELIRPHIIESFVRKVLIGQNPMNREKIWQELAHWQRGSASQFTDRALALVEQALWDLAGRALKLPVHQLLGGVPRQGTGLRLDHVRRRPGRRVVHPGRVRAVCREVGAARLQRHQAAHLDATDFLRTQPTHGCSGLRRRP